MAGVDSKARPVLAGAEQNLAFYGRTCNAVSISLGKLGFPRFHFNMTVLRQLEALCIKAIYMELKHLPFLVENLTGS